MKNSEYELLKFIQSHRAITNELEAFSKLKLSMQEGSEAITSLQQKKYILSGLFWDYITPQGSKALEEAKESFEIEIVL